MKKKEVIKKLFLVFLFAASSTCAQDKSPKHSLKSNYQISYNEVPSGADNIGEMFSKGMVYGRLRLNTLSFNWEKENIEQKNHVVSAVGGSLVYKSATFNDVDFTSGFYYSKAFFDNPNDDVALVRAAKDFFSRYNYSNSGDTSMAMVGQAYITYSGITKTRLSLGRQLVETFYTKTNDTKMIPNTFDGIVMQSTLLADSDVKLAYLVKQKARDHTTSHSVLMYGDSNSSSSLNPQWNSSDDIPMHQGLTFSRLQSAGIKTDAPLITGDIHNKSFKDVSLNTSFYAVPQLVSQMMGEVNYKVNLNAFSITPGIRYIKQFDNGAGEVGGASYNGKLAGLSGESGGYKKASSLESQMVAARLVTAYKNYKLNLGYSKVFDEADLIAPWRGFPTGGYTRSMTRYNWMANTKSYRAELTRGENKNGIYKDMFMRFSVLYTDADETKGYFDEIFYYADFIKNIDTVQNMQLRVRLGYNDTKKTDADTLDGRLEINYLF